MSVSISASSYVCNESTPVIAVKITPGSLDPMSARRPFHLAMLLDTSGSMAGERITALCRTLHLLVDSLREHDVLTLITYHSIAHVRANCTEITSESRPQLHTIIDAVRAEGGTNMEAAISELLVMGTDASKPAIDAVFILTDGHINSGMTSSSGLLRLLQNQINRGIPINTLGYGSDHNSRLLRDMALRSHGTYTFADANEVLPAIIGDIMGGLESEIGRCTKLTIPEGWTCIELQTSGEIGTLIAEKTQWLVMTGAGPLPHELKLTWTSATGDQTATCAVDSSIPMLEVVEQYERCCVAKVFSDITEDIEAFRISEAKAKLQTLAAKLATSPAKDTTFVIRLQAQVDDMIESLKPMDLPAAVAGRPPGLARTNSFGPDFFGLGGVPSVAPVVSRLASNTTVLGNQRGISYGGRGGGISPALFSSPSQRSASDRMTQAYQEHEHA